VLPFFAPVTQVKRPFRAFWRGWSPPFMAK
jgi:hypothetical protein